MAARLRTTQSVNMNRPRACSQANRTITATNARARNAAMARRVLVLILSQLRCESFGIVFAENRSTGGALHLPPPRQLHLWSCAEVPIAGVAEPGYDVAKVIQLRIDRRGDNFHIRMTRL